MVRKATSQKCIGIMREVKNKWERRAAIVPNQVSQLVKQGVQVLVQPSDRRIFTNQEYAQAGAILTEDISSANTLFGVKEFPPETLMPDRTYVLFAHVIKAQPYSMPFLDACLQKNVRLIDYECIRAPKSEGGQRLVAFGRFAGLAGMVDCFRGLGERFLSKGISTPFMGVSSSYMYPDLNTAKRAVKELGQQITRAGLPDSVGPLTFVFTGAGNVAQGAQEIFSLLPHEMVAPQDLPKIAKKKITDRVIGCIVSPKDIVSPIQDGFQMTEQHYFANPQFYKPVFHEKIAPYTSVLVNGMYWDRRYPRLLTIDQLADLQVKSQLPFGLVSVADISCDIEGSVEFLTQSSTIDRPFYIYDVNNRTTSWDLETPGVIMLGVDNLPAEFPREASEHFSNKLAPFIAELAVPEGAAALSESMTGATIASGGKLAPDFQYITQLRQVREAEEAKAKDDKPATAQMFHGAMSIKGHLFDSGLINTMLDVVEHYKASYRVAEWNIGQDRVTKTEIVLHVEADSPETVKTIENKIRELAKIVPNAQAVVAEVPYHAPSKPVTTTAASGRGAAGAAADSSAVESKGGATKAEKHVLILGAGYVSGPVVEYLSRSGKNSIVVGSVVLGEAQKLVETWSKAGRAHLSAVRVDAANTGELSALVKAADVVVSLLPATMHPPIAELCLQHQKHLVTASYVSPALKAMHDKAIKAGVTFLNEVGLDPGIDHMSAMSVIQDVQHHGGEIVEFESVCGGLPAPEAADNPLGYKFSWNPRGVLTAAQNEAKYLQDGKVVEIAGADLLSSASPFVMNPAFALEQLPNRNSLPYMDLYGIKTARTMYRGTLRYAGFSGVMDCFQKLGLFDQSKEKAALLKQAGSWSELMVKLATGANKSAAPPDDVVRARLASLSLPSVHVDRAVHTAKWLGLLSEDKDVIAAPTLMDSFCSVLQEKLSYKPGERDMVIMNHTFGIKWPNGRKETKTSSLLAYGDKQWSAMAITVGYPTAVGVQLILDGKFKRRGVVTPVTKDIYQPVLEELKEEGITFHERSSEDHEA